MSMDEMLRAQVQLDSNARLNKLGATAWGLGFTITPTPYGLYYSHGGNNWGYTGEFVVNTDKKFGFIVISNSDQVNAVKRDFINFLVKGE